jgi:two-component system sensor histidine kinase CpxA
VLFVTEILIFGLFVHTVGKPLRERFDKFSNSKLLIAKEAVEQTIRLEPDAPLSENRSLNDFVLRFKKMFGADIWITDEHDVVLLKSFADENLPINHDSLSQRHKKDGGDFKVIHDYGENFEAYTTIPIEISDQVSGTVHVLFREEGRHFPEWQFALGLAAIGLIIVLLILPISKIITDRIKLLRHSASQIAEGDLSHRVEVKGRDEIGELGRAFNRMADKLESMIRGSRELTANISHELRSPLARIRVSEELLRDKLAETDRENLLRHMNDIREDIDQLDHLIGRILEISKLDIYETPLIRESIDISSLINDILDRLAPIISSKELRLKKDIFFSSTFTGDREAIQTALSNIFDNAVKFTEEKGEIIVETLKENNDSLTVNITNSFQRLTVDELDNLFEPFYRTKKTSKKGSGLGLAIARKIIERHGGRIEAQNAEAGLMFKIILPLNPIKKET